MMPASSSDESQFIFGEFTLVAKWGKERITLEKLPSSTTIGQVKTMLTKRTGVLPKRQKLIGLSVQGNSKLSDEVTLSKLKTKGKPQPSAAVSSDTTTTSTKAGPAVAEPALQQVVVHQFILMGSAEQDIFVDPNERDDLPDVVDDFDFDFTAGSEEWVQHVATGENLKKFTESTAVYIMHEPREGFPLMVLDLDHTLLDFSSKALQQDSTHRVGEGNALSMKRPYMDEFLAAAYREYDLVVWSQTSWRWLEVKLTELGMVANPAYKFCFVLDKTSMFSITSTKRDGTSYKHQVKPLQIIWTKFPHWGAHNTVHLDDLSRNFALNLSSGLKVTAYNRKRTSGKRDAELVGLSRYLAQLAKANIPFDHVDFTKWMRVVSGEQTLAETRSTGVPKQPDGNNNVKKKASF
jgi:ubiquitin-like domain-containing CTD phosphatase 1